MSNTVQAQHPAVVLRSNYQHLRALLMAAIIAIVGLTAAVVVLATSHSGSTITSLSAQANRTAVHASPPPAIGPNPDQQGVQTSVAQPATSANRTADTRPNPDQQRLENSVAQPTTSYYPGPH